MLLVLDHPRPMDPKQFGAPGGNHLLLHVVMQADVFPKAIAVGRIMLNELKEGYS